MDFLQPIAGAFAVQFPLLATFVARLLLQVAPELPSPAAKTRAMPKVIQWRSPKNVNRQLKQNTNKKKYTGSFKNTMGRNKKED